MQADYYSIIHSICSHQWEDKCIIIAIRKYYSLHK